MAKDSKGHGSEKGATKTLNDLTPAQAKEIRLLGNKIFRVMPSSPKQKELIEKRAALMKKHGLTSLFSK